MRRDATARHSWALICPAQKRKGTDMLAKKRRGVERSSNASHSNGLAQIGSVMSRHEKEKLRAAKQRHCDEELIVDQKRKGNALHCIQKKEMR